MLTRYIGHLIPFAKVGRSLVVEQGILHFAVGATDRKQLPLLLALLVLGTSRWTDVIHVFPLLWFVVDDHRGTVAQVGLIDEHRPAVLLLEDLADDAEVRGRLPASFQLATAGHAVALAANLHVVRYGLERGNGNGGC